MSDSLGWPFWAPTTDERIEGAFDLARLAEGERLVDLGCGDGRVLLRATLRGASVVGIEIDPAMAEQARALLREHGVEGGVVEADFESVDLSSADVVFAFLSPATLQRLTVKLAAELAPGARVVTTGYGIPGWQPSSVSDRCFLYELPPTPADDLGAVGWITEGLLSAVRADAVSLSAIRMRHPGGPVVVRADDELSSWATVRVGADSASAGQAVVVDLRWEPRGAGSTVIGTLSCEGVGDCTVIGIWTEEGSANWGLSADGVEQLGEAVRRGDDPEQILDRARAEA